MTSNYRVRIHMNTMKDYMNYQRFIWTHSFHADILAGSRCLDAHRTERMLFMMPLHEVEMHFSWMPDEKMNEIRCFFKTHGMQADEVNRTAGNLRPAYQA